MTASRRLGVLGGTFDPIHFGHLDAGNAAQSALGLDEVRLIPAHDPPHRSIDPRASAFHRFALAALAVADRPSWRVSDVEVTREGPSYSIDTLRTLHAEGWTALQIFFILGADAFAEIATWQKFPEVLDAAHFAVVARPGMTLDAAVARTPQLGPRVRLQPDPANVGSETAIFLIEARTRDVSSSAVRTRLAAGLSIDDLVPAPVARHITAHQLYGAVDDLHGEKQRTHR
jgi:nicotinate-nucleotide adenylyltransferase